MGDSLQDLRLNYNKESLSKEDLQDDPIVLFEHWMNHAISKEVLEPNAMVLSTANKAGEISSRVVLIKEISEAGFIFYTNYNSRKGAQIEENSNGAMVFFWKEVERQVRIEGKIEKVSQEKSEQYFQSRPKGSQIGAWCSPQSEYIDSRDILEKRKAELEEQYKDQDVLPCPPHWGGYLVRPNRIEFWQGRPSRLHDRFCYEWINDQWKINRLAP